MPIIDERSFVSLSYRDLYEHRDAESSELMNTAEGLRTGLSKIAKGLGLPDRFKIVEAQDDPDNLRLILYFKLEA